MPTTSTGQGRPMFNSLRRFFFGPSEPTVQQRIAEKTALLEERLIESQLNWFDNLVDLREPFYDTQDFWLPLGNAEQVPPNIDNRKRGEALPVYTTEFGLKILRDQSRRLCAYNEFAINAVENRVSYIVGKGVQYKACPKSEDDADGELVKQVQAVIDEFLARNAWGEREQEIVRRADRDGECIIRFFRPQGDDAVVVRFVEPEHLKSPDSASNATRFGIESEPDDVESVKGFWIVNSPDANQAPEFVPADEVLHIKLNSDSSAKRGIPTFTPVRKNLERAEKLLQNMSTLAAVRATYAVLRKHKKFSGSAISAFQQANADVSVNNPGSTGPSSTYLKRMLPGSILDTSDDTEYQFPSAEVDAASLVEILSAELRAIASRLVMPEYMLTSDASNANYASTMVAEAPSTRNFERLQAFFTRRFGDGSFEDVRTSGAIWRAIYWSVDAGRLPPEALTRIKIQAEGPPIVAREKDKETNRAKTLNEAKVLSKATWSKWEGLDHEQERRQIESEGQDEQGQYGGSEGTDPFGMLSDDGSDIFEAEDAGNLVAEAKRLVAAIFRSAGEDVPDLDENAALEAVQRMLEDGTLTEACVKNEKGTGFHDDKTGHPCKTGQDDASGQKDAGRGKLGQLFASAGQALSGHALSGKAKAVVGKIKTGLVNKFKTMEGKYGRKGAIAVMAAMVALTPIPVPGTSFAPILVAEGVRAVARLFKPKEAAALSAHSSTGLATATASSGQRFAFDKSLSPEHRKEVDRVVGALKAASHLTNQQKSEYASAAQTVIGRMSAPMLERFSKGQTDSPTFYADSRKLAEGLAAKYPSKAGDLLKAGVHIAGMYERRVTKKEAGLHLDGGSPGQGNAAKLTSEVYAHEFGHAIDGPDFELSSRQDWQDAWKAEMAGNRFSEYASSKPSEGFAEFARAVLTPERFPPAMMQKHFPRCYAVWQSHKLVESRHMQDDGFDLTEERFEIPEIFGESIEMPDGSIVDTFRSGDLSEGCVKNKTGKGFHDDQTGHPCKSTGGKSGDGPADYEKRKQSDDAYRSRVAKKLGSTDSPRGAVKAIRTAFGEQGDAHPSAVAEAVGAAILGHEMRSGGSHGFDTAGKRSDGTPVFIDIKTSKQKGYDEKPDAKLAKVREWQQRGGIPAYLSFAEGNGVYLHVGIDPASSVRFGDNNKRKLVQPDQFRGDMIDGRGGPVPAVLMSSQWKSLDDLKKATPEQVQAFRDNVAKVMEKIDMDELKQHLQSQTAEYKGKLVDDLIDLDKKLVVERAVDAMSDEEFEEMVRARRAKNTATTR